PKQIEEPKTNQEQTETPEQAEENIDAGADLNELEETEKITMVLIKDTETGWLNVRQGPGKQYAILVKIYPGEKYPFLEEKNKWYKIELKDKTQGWILSDYATKIVIN
ncbi:MAG: SH3 domain-containing protein, partial [Candidatus Omnitrophota bacterium]|nr:SH3 domain-containing protein [Candidatus Omnitrophota bacterium]